MTIALLLLIVNNMLFISRGEKKEREYVDKFWKINLKKAEVGRI